MSESACGKANSGSDSNGKEFSCDYCSESYDTQQALNSHRGQKHPSEARQTVECGYCGTDIDVINSEVELHENHFCDRDCKSHFRSESPKWNGENHPRYDKIKVECDYCGSQLERHRSRVERFDNQYCNSECLGAHYSETDRLAGENNPAYNSITKECDWCGDEYTVPVSISEQGRRFCGKDCWANFMSDYMSGEGSPLYTGYYEQTYGNNWDEHRQKARKRDNYRCQSCGVHEDDLCRELDVHHITPLKHFDDPEKANKLENLVCLCGSCHSKWEGLYLRPDSR